VWRGPGDWDSSVEKWEQDFWKPKLERLEPLD
jgi:hypothetical protein